MADTLLTPNIIAKEALMQLENNLVMGKLVHREYKNEFVKVGDTVTIRKPVRFEAKSGSTAVIQDVLETSTTITVDKRYHVAWDFSTQDLTLTIEEYSERYIKPAASVLANQIDMDLLALYQSVYNAVGTAGTTPSTFQAIADAATRLDNFAVPTDRRRLVLNPEANWKLADALKGLFWQEKVRDVIRKGYLGSIAGFDIYMAQNVKKHTKGSASGYLVNGANQTGSPSAEYQDLVVDTGTGMFKAGDIITIAGVNAVNPVSKQDLGIPMQFVVVQDSADPATSVRIAPPIIASGPYQNVTAAPADNAAISIVDSHVANLAFHRNAFALVTVPLELPDGASFKARMTYNGISIRVLKDYDINNDQEIIRLDILYGVKCIYPELAVRLMG